MEIKEIQKNNIPSLMPLLTLREAVLFPHMIMPIIVKRDFSINSVNQAISTDRLLFVTTQKNREHDEIDKSKIFHTGCVGAILKMQKLYDGKVKLLIQGVKKAKMTELEKREDENFFLSTVSVNKEKEETDHTPEVEAIANNIKNGMRSLIKNGETSIPRDISGLMNDISDPARLAEMVVSHLGSSVELAQSVLEADGVMEKLTIVNDYIEEELEILSIQNSIKNRAKKKLGKTQKEYILKEQMRQIQKELGEDDPHSSELTEYEERLKEKNLPDYVQKDAEKQLRRLQTMNPASSETSVIKTYLDTVLDIPWLEKTEDNEDINKARKILEEDHYGLEEIKERILEFLSVRQVKGNSKSPILCFIGPPGVGKTSLGKSIARALDRKFYRLSLGGLHDEAEIRGHRRTYVGAMPGKIIQGIKDSGTSNPVFMLDEIDKVGKDFRGDPSSALLEVLDPEQNDSFVDNYLKLKYDLSNVFFITTGNWENTIPGPLRDRMEIIRLSGYADDEKLHIAKQYLIPRQLEYNGLEKTELKFTEPALIHLARRYTRESGVRELERIIGSICRKTVKRKISNEKVYRRITKSVVEKLLNVPPYSDMKVENEPNSGVVTGLAWTKYGGSILRIEANYMKGSGNIKLTGKLGDIMKESASIALSFIRSNSADFGIDGKFDFDSHDIHIHVPSGAVPKDGPSAGVTITTALISMLRKEKVSPLAAMTGEVSLTGKVLPVGGLREKILVAIRNGVETIFLPEKNRPDIKKIKKNITSSVDLKFVSDYLEIFRELFEKNEK